MAAWDANIPGTPPEHVNNVGSGSSIEKRTPARSREAAAVAATFSPFTAWTGQALHDTERGQTALPIM